MGSDAALLVDARRENRETVRRSILTFAACRSDNPKAKVQMLGTGHFALETHVEEIVAAMPTSEPIRQLVVPHDT